MLQVGVKILLQNDEGRFLLLRRSTEKYQNIKGTWDIPGGRINPGQTLLENLQREVREETNLEIVDEPKLVAAQDIIREDRHVVRLTYTGVASGEVQLDISENVEYRWLTIEQIKAEPDLDIYLAEAVKDFLV